MKPVIHLLEIVTVLSLFGFIAACGGGGGTEIEPPTLPPEPVSIHDAKPMVNYEAASVVLYQGFDDRQIGTYTKDMLCEDLFDAYWCKLDGAGEIVADESQADNLQLAITVPAGKFKTGLAAYSNIGEYTSLYLSFSVRFLDGFDWQKGGKLPGLGGMNPDIDETPTGCKDIAPDAGFSARAMFRSEGWGGQYLYHQDKESNCGDDADFIHEGEGFFFQAGKTYLIEQRIVINDSGEANGINETYINGFQVLSINDKSWSESNVYGVNRLFFDFWHGGDDTSWAPDSDSTAIIDDVALSTTALSY